MSTKMKRAEAETFLAGIRVGVLSLDEPGRGPLAVPVWYGYEAGGEVWFITERGSRKGKLIGVGQRVSLCAQDDTPPYRYVSVEGPIRSITSADREKHQRPLARRYLGVDGGDRYVESEGVGPESILVRMLPERWLTADYTENGL